MEACSLFDVSSAVHTKSAEGVVSPMVVELYHLILAVELGEVNHEALVGLVKTAEVLARATEQLSCVARRLAEESKDEVFKQEVMPVSESLLVSGKNILLVAQKLLIQHGAAVCMKELALTAKKVLVETINLLRTEDSATIRRISQAACRLQGCLHKLESTENLSAMSVAFRSFSEAFLPLMGLTQNFLWDCRECLHWKHLAETFQVLKNCIPMLYTAKVNNLKYPSDQQVRLSKGYIFDVTSSTVKKLISLLSHGMGIQKLYERSGLFAQHLDKLLSLLSNSQLADLRDGKLDIFVETVVSCSVLLAESSRPPVKLKLIKLSHCLLKFRKLIVMDVSMMEESPAKNHLEENTVEMCFALRAELENLKETVQTAVLYQVLDNFLEPEEPLQRLVAAAAAAAAAMEPSSPPEKGHFLRNLRPHITEFFNHSGQMLKAASFVLITCLDTKVIQDIESCIDSLSKCLAVVPTILSEMDHGPRNKAVERLSFLSWMWSSTTGSLLMCLDQAIELRAFLKLSVQEMGQHKEETEMAFSNQQFRAFSWHAMRLSLQAIQIVEFVKRHVARTRDPVFRNGLLALVQQLEDCIPQLKFAADESLRMMLNPKAKAEYSKKARDLIEFACQVQKGLDECNQPDILSPLRDRVRNRSISKDHPCCFTPESSTETSEENDRKQNGSHNSKNPEESLARSSSIHCLSPRNLTGSITISAEATENHDMYPLIRELLSITKMYNISRVNSFCSDLLEISTCYVDAAKEVLSAAKSPVSEKLIHYREIVALMPHLLSLVRKGNQDPISIMERLLQTAVLLSEKIEETKQCLILVASSWYSLARQLFCTRLPPDLPDDTQKINEIMAILRTIVQLVGKAVSVYHNREIPEFPRLHEAFLQVKAKFTCVQTRTKHLLEKGQAVSQLCSNQMQQECFDANCIMWSIAIQAFLHSVDQFIGRDVLCLRELQTKVKQRLCLQSTLAAVSEGSLRIQEAIRLSFLSSTGNSAKNEIMVLKEQMKTLTDALLRVADILSTSPLPAPNLSVRFELLQRELAVTATVLLLQLGVVNREYLNTIQDIISPSQPMLPDSESCSDIVNQKAAASRLLVNVQKVKKIIGNAMESPCFLKLKESLFSTVDHLLVLTDEVMERAEKLQNQPEEELFLEDSILYEWSSVAMYLVGQLQSTEGISATDLECVKQCLQNHEERAHSDQLVCKSQALVGAEDQNLLIPEHKETHKNMQPQEDPQGELQPKTSEQDLSANSAALLAGSETWWHHSWSVAQVTKQMATQVSYMAQFLKRKGPITTKEQLIACATEIVTGGETLIRFAGIIAKNCQDERCAAELVHIMEQAKMVGYQLSIISRVNASTGKSRSSTEHVVSNAQNLLRMVIQMLKAAEAACIKNLQPSFSNTEEADVAAFCSQWKKSLWWHRVKEALNSDRDELGLRKTGSWSEPTFTAMIQKVSV